MWWQLVTRIGKRGKLGQTEWLQKGTLAAETEAVVVAAQDGVINTRAYQVRAKVSQQCRACLTRTETLGHILAACPVYKWRQYKDRHDRVLLLLATAVMEGLELPIPGALTGVRGTARPGVYCTEERVVMVDQTSPTDKVIEERRPDLLVSLLQSRRIEVFEVACAWDPLVQVNIK